MKVSFDASTLRTVRPHQYAIRFVLGGLATVGAGLVAKYAGPVVGGLFLAFPALFTAGATLIEKRARTKKEHKGLAGVRRGRQAAALDAAGTVLGSIGLVCFACVVWLTLSGFAASAVLGIAGLAWLVISSSLWWLRKKHWLLSTHRQSHYSR